jgi:hypothetical protein
MRIKTATGILIGLLAISAFVTFATLRAQTSQDGRKVTLENMKSGAGDVVVEILRPEVDFKARNAMGKASFTVRNSSSKNIVAFCLAYTTQIERKGNKSGDTRYHTMTPFVHKDFDALDSKAKLIVPGQEVVVVESGSTTYDSETVVTGVEVTLDYVEFDDGSTLGVNQKGAYLVSKIWEGADEYSSWLKQVYFSSGKSAAEVGRIVQSPDIPADLGFTTSQQNLGAKAYKNGLRRLYERVGPFELGKFLEKTWSASTQKK